ncbi:MAG: sodium:solute symporter family protein [Candidatus Marinimicrobia bacterium]|jgi:SSS family solute:Na+ symporter|nr:sodium:solute symporter family protein [Candidatus Neomarinimicrobiota bacterium]MBT3501613.1 sodium:solute symporter family protein [Candidatus Neomarinimicrobiota bacterium]MBT3838323.1 sodium:solute symporter family protein [Candidatus Neomarinimicrobiota bacterium]MBT4000135.1 sodium:solute symporter family protein [Candidatus Neomarinimicrobiota bacterium]MBT4281683.1 sodium:solute symporter family protein [Candidatus Neomarinimicrobiota bacterium]
MHELATIDYIIIGIYLAGMVSVGLWFAKKHTDFEDFFLAGRSLTTPLLITTLISTYYGIDVLFGDSQLGFTNGVVAWFGYARPTYAFFLIAAFLLAHRLREDDFKSLPDILDKYYGKKTRYVGAVTSFIYSLPALSLYGFGMLGDVILGWEPIVGMLILGGIALVYTLTGGFWAVALTDSIQFVLMCVILALAFPYAMKLIGGFDAMIEVLEPSYFDTMGDMSIWLIIIYASTGLSILVDPTFYQRIFAAKSYKNVRNALVIGIFIWGSYDWIITILAMAAKVAVIQGTLPMDVPPDAALLKVMVAALPAGALGLFMAGVLSTEMSTLDSYCLVAGGNVAYDIYKPAFKPEATDQELIKTTRQGILLSWVLGFIMAISFDQMLGLWVFMASILISSVMVPILLGMYVPKFRKPLAGFLSAGLGLGSTVILNIYIMTNGVFDVEEETYIIQWFGIDFIQEFIMYITVPISLIGFFVGVIFDKGDPHE